MDYASLDELVTSEEASMDYFNSLPESIRRRLIAEDNRITSFEKLEKRSDEIRREEYQKGEVAQDER